MAQPTPYTPTADFSADELANVGGRATVRTAALDAEFDALNTTLDGVLRNLALNQRDDGEIRDERVKLHTLGSDVKALLAAGQGLPRGAWATATDYDLRDMVRQGSATYICALAHTSDTFATDLAAGRWLLISLGVSSSADGIAFSPTTNIPAISVQSAVQLVDNSWRTFAANLASPATAGAGAGLVGFDEAMAYPAGSVGAALVEALTDAPTATAIYANVREAPFNAAGDGVVNDTAAFQAALATGRPVWVPPGVYLLDTVLVPGNSVIRGAGAGRVLLVQNTTAGTSFGMLHADSGSPSSTLDNITISDMTLQGAVASLGFSEFVHLIHLSGVRNVLLERLVVQGFRGDGIYLGSSPTSGQIRHNYNVTIRNCVIDGLINDNRNGLSVIDVDGLEVTGCVFQNCTRSNMPGAIDMEPDSNASHVVFNVRIHHNTFTNIGGNAGAVSLLFIQPLYTLPRNILIESNIFDGRVAGTIGSDVVVSIKRNWITSDPDLGVRIVGNVGRNGGRTVEVYGCKGVTVAGNSWSTYTFGALIGYTNATEQRAIGVRWEGNRCHKVAMTSRTGLAIGNATDVDVRSNEFVDSGDGGAGSRHIGFMGGLSQNVRLIGNRYSAPTGQTLAATSVDAGHGLNIASNVEQGELLLDGLSSGFRAWRSDRVVPTVRARVTTSIPMASSAGTLTAYVSFNAVEEDNCSWYNGTTGTTTVQLAGLYSIDANVLVDYLSPSAVGVPGGGITAQIEVNGTRVATGMLIQNGDPANACVGAVNVSRPVRLAVGDSVRISLALFANNHAANIIAGGSGYSTTLAIRYLGA